MSDTNELIATLVSALKNIATTAQQASLHEPEQFCEWAYNAAQEALSAASNTISRK